MEAAKQQVVAAVDQVDVAEQIEVVCPPVEHLLQRSHTRPGEQSYLVLYLAVCLLQQVCTTHRF